MGFVPRVVDVSKAFPMTVTVTRCGMWPEGRQWAEWDSAGIGLPTVEGLVKVGDQLTFYWPDERSDAWGGTPLAVSINGSLPAAYPRQGDSAIESGEW